MNLDFDNSFYDYTGSNFQNEILYDLTLSDIYGSSQYYELQ